MIDTHRASPAITVHLPVFVERALCRSCHGALEPVLDLGSHYLSSFPLPGADPGPRVPLELMRCQLCTLVQLRHTTEPDLLYREYWYRSGTNESMRTALGEIVHLAERAVSLEIHDVVLDIGSNDGTLLKQYKSRGIVRIGVDPARNIETHHQEPPEYISIKDYFSAKNRVLTSFRKPKIITAIAMFYDLDDPNRFVADIKETLHKDGYFIIQMSYLPAMLRQNAFDNICHEHLQYYTLKSLETLLSRHQLQIVEATFNEVNGGSVRVWARHMPGRHRPHSHNLDDLFMAEDMLGLQEQKPFDQFRQRVETIKTQVVDFITQEQLANKMTYVYGASTKGNTLLQYFGIDRHLVPFAADRSEFKWGRVTVGSGIPIISEEQARAEHPDYFLVLPWHFLEGFRAREAQYLATGGKFIVPLPHFEVLSS